MALAATQLAVPDRQSLDSAITSYIAQGFTVQNRGDDFAVMFKKKEFSVLWAVVGFIVCLLPLLVYLVIYATQKDQLVEIRVAPSGQFRGLQQGLEAGPSEAPWSEDGEYWWDGSQWRWYREGLPVSTPMSPDGEHFYDGRQWRATPAELQARAKGDARHRGGDVPTRDGRKVIEFDSDDEGSA